MLLVTVLPLPAAMPLGSLARATARAAIFIESPTRPLSPAHRAYVALFGLTRAECRVADALLCGLRPKEMAESLSVSESTIRTHVKALHAKTGTRGMSALGMLLTRVAATHAVPDA